MQLASHPAVLTSWPMATSKSARILRGILRVGMPTEHDIVEERKKKRTHRTPGTYS